MICGFFSLCGVGRVNISSTKIYCDGLLGNEKLGVLGKMNGYGAD